MALLPPRTTPPQVLREPPPPRPNQPKLVEPTPFHFTATPVPTLRPVAPNAGAPGMPAPDEYRTPPQLMTPPGMEIIPSITARDSRPPPTWTRPQPTPPRFTLVPPKRLLLKDYNPDQPRDEAGRWAQVEGAVTAALEPTAPHLHDHPPTLATDTVREFLNNAARFEPAGHWYDNFKPTATELFGTDEPVFAKILAATSPLKAPETNIQLALKAFEHYKVNGDFKTFKGAMPSVMEDLHQIARGEGITGPKIEPFERALQGDPNAVVIDSRMAEALFKAPLSGSGGAAVSPGMHRAAQRVVTALAQQMGWEPRRMQAAIWAFQGEVNKTKDYRAENSSGRPMGDLLRDKAQAVKELYARLAK